MKLYLNKNFCGYRWFEIEDLANCQNIIVLEQAKRNPKMPAIYGELMTYGVYDYALLTSDNDLILSIRGIEDSRLDSMGRHIKISAIFCEKNNEDGFDRLHKILLAYLSDTEGFSAWLDGLFDAKISQLEFNVSSLKEGLAKIEQCQIISKMGVGGLKYDRRISIYSIASDYNANTIAEQLSLPCNIVAEAKTTIDENKSLWLAESFNEEKVETDNKIFALEDENRTLKRKIEELAMPVPPLNIKDVLIKYKQYFITVAMLGFIIGLVIGKK